MKVNLSNRHSILWDIFLRLRLIWCCFLVTIFIEQQLMINFHRATLVNSLQCPTRCHWHLTDFLSQVPVDDNPVVDLLQRARFLSSLQRWQHRVCDFQSASRGGLQEIGYRDHRRIAAGALFNTLQQHLAPPRNTTPPPYRFTGPWSLPQTESAAYNLPGSPPIPPQLILWEGIVMQMKDA